MATDDHRQLSTQYARRFEQEDLTRRRVWRVLVSSYFSRYLDGTTSVLDLGCGWGHFINQVDVPERHGIDLNPDAARHLDPGVRLHRQAADERWPLDDGHLDLVFTSNFFEHLPGPPALAAALAEAHRCLRPGGRIVCMGPNIRVVGGAYWDFLDHVIPLTDRSMVEALELAGFEIESSIARFLPFTMAGKRPPPSPLIRAYLHLRPAWRILGGQFLVVGTRSGP
ncbi:MAG: class I SAM-dependent methyltransferase [Acidimicrobiales bacterium]